MPDPGVVQQEVFPAALRGAATDPPDGGPVALHPSGDRLDRFAGGDGEHDPGMLDLEPGQAAPVGHRLQDGDIRISAG
jgi:hypothetical protein